MKITIIYDNTVFDRRLHQHWGFACLVEAHGKSVLFDTGTLGWVLLGNMALLDIDPEQLDAVFISHPHSDHMGGLVDFLNVRSVPVFLPDCSPKLSGAQNVAYIKESTEIFPNIHSTGELENIEQSLLVRQGEDVAVIVGCSHSGVGDILKVASGFGSPSALIGGLHGFDAFDLLIPLKIVCPTHCTQHIEHIRTHFADKFVEGGAGKVIEIKSR
jgi:7,8-dihydropterin-6-yl-methyl-4-(beta-D-ribofuranosyl)aminobenzene 5'-phosphate synthase